MRALFILALLCCKKIMKQPAVLITGSASRLGAEIARGFADQGWHVVIHHLNSGDEAEALASELASAETVQLDLCDDEAAVDLVENLSARLPNLRCLINSASVFRYDHSSMLDNTIYREAMQINALSPVRMAQTFLACSKGAAPRSVIHITDMKLENPNPDFFSYTMSKHALASSIDMFAMAADADARIYGIAPGAILASHDQSEDEAETSHRLNLLQRRTNAREVAEAAMFLAQGALKSGSTLFIDSGQHLMQQARDVIYLAREPNDTFHSGG